MINNLKGIELFQDANITGYPKNIDLGHPVHQFLNIQGEGHNNYVKDNSSPDDNNNLETLMVRKSLHISGNKMKALQQSNISRFQNHGSSWMV